MELKLKNLTSDARLGLRLLFLQPIKRLIAPPGRLQFARNFFPEGLVPTTLEERERLAEASRCTGCGLCDAVGGAGPRPSLLATTFSRASFDLPHVQRELTEFARDPARLEAAEAMCPSAVPLRRLHRFLQQRTETCTELKKSAMNPTQDTHSDAGTHGP
jgi:ferredoxin